MLLIKKNKVFMLVLLLSIVITFPVDLMAQVTFERTYGGTDAYTCYSVEQTSDGGFLAAGSIRHIATNDYDVYLMKTNSYGDTLWTRFYNNQPIDICFSMQLTSDGGCIMAGYTGVWPDYKALLIKTDAIGDTLWTRSYTCADATIGYFGKSVQQTSDGEYIITGYTGNADYSNDIFLIKTNSYGDTLWTQIYDKNEYDVGNSVKQTSDGGFIIAGKTAFSWYSYVFLIKTDAEGDTLWTQTYGDADSQEGTDIQLTSDGGYIICGNVTDESTYTKDVYLVKTDGSGQILWTQAYGGIYDEFGNSVQQTADGGYVIAGYTVNYPIIDIYLVKTDVIGDTLWTRSYGCENMEYGYSVQQTADEGYIIGGYSNNQSTSRDEVYLLKTDQNGMVPVPDPITFERTYGGTDAYTCYSVEQTSDGGYLAAGSIRHIATNDYDVYLMKTNSYGDTLWTRFYNNQPIDICFSMQLTSDGGCIMAGYTGVWPDYKALLIKTDAVGDTLWTRSYTCADATIGYFGQSVQQTSDGEYIITGYTGNADYSNDIFLIKTNSYGDTLWTKIYDKNEYDVGNSVKQTSDGGYIIAGKTAFSWYSYVFLIKTDAAGDTLWTQTYGDTDSQEGTDIQLTSDGGYIICGNVTDVSTYTKDVYLIKTDGSGQVLWTQAYGGIYDEFGNSVQQTADGGYVIAGYTVNYPIIDIYLVKTDVIGDTLWTRSYGCENMEYGYSVQQTADEGYIIGGYSNNQSTSRDEVYLLKTDQNGMVPVPGWIAGNISLDGGSGNVENVELTAGNVTVNPDANGDYTIEIASGTYDVTASLDDYEPDTVFDVVVIEGVITTDIDLLLTYIFIDEQQITLNTGYSFVSSRIFPADPDMLEVLQSVLNDDLDFVRNSAGNMLRKIGPNWVNGIGDWIVAEGYLFKMFADDSFTITGASVDPATPISVVTGYQFVSYFPENAMDALSAFGSIIGDDLDFIRSSAGQMIRKIGPNWVNGIGDAVPGEGYLVKMLADGEIIYPAAAKSSGKTTINPTHFIFDGGNAADPVFTIYVDGLEIGDEVAAYNGDIILGSMTVTSDNVYNNALPVFSQLTNGQGYKAGEPISLKVWSDDNIVTAEYEMESVYDSYISNFYPSNDGEFSFVNITKGSIIINDEIMVYPNPATDVINISSSEAIINVMILNSAGHLVYEGNTTKIKTSNFSSGFYIIRIKTEKGIKTQKLTIK